MSLGKALFSGLVGACALTLLHETARRFVEDAPRLDILGERAIAEPLLLAGFDPPQGDKLYWTSLAGDIISNSLYYSLIGLGAQKNAYRNAAVLGVAAGVGSVILPEHLGLGSDPTGGTKQTGVMTVAWYLTGSLAAAATYRYLTDKS